MHLLALLGIAATVFASTNIDDVFILLMFLSDPRFTAPQVVAGQYLGIGALVAISVVGSLVSLVIPPAWIGLLGIFPLGIGLMKLRQLWMASEEEEEEATELTAGYSNILMVAGVTFANGGDNLGVYIPLFATYALWEVAVMVGVFLLLVAVWCAAAWYLIEHPQTGHLVKRYGHMLLPFVLIGLGIWILWGALPLIYPHPAAVIGFAKQIVPARGLKVRIPAKIKVLLANPRIAAGGTGPDRSRRLSARIAGGPDRELAAMEHLQRQTLSLPGRRRSRRGPRPGPGPRPAVRKPTVLQTTVHPRQVQSHIP